MGTAPERLPGSQCPYKPQSRWVAHFPAASSVTGVRLKPLHLRWNQAADGKWKSCSCCSLTAEHADEWIRRLRGPAPHTVGVRTLLRAVGLFGLV